MVKDSDEGWMLPRRKPITKAVLDRAIGAEEEASQEHQAREAWFDSQHGTVMLKLTDGRVFGAEPGFIPLLQGASLTQFSGLRVSNDGVYLVIESMDLHINVDGLVTRIMEGSPLAIKRSGARLAGLTTSPAKAVASARNGTARLEEVDAALDRNLVLVIRPEHRPAAEPGMNGVGMIKGDVEVEVVFQHFEATHFLAGGQDGVPSFLPEDVELDASI